MKNVISFLIKTYSIKIDAACGFKEKYKKLVLKTDSGSAIHKQFFFDRKIFFSFFLSRYFHCRAKRE